MRAIKFRVWNEESKTLTPDITLDIIAKEYCTILKRKTNEYVWEQFTGLTDKNGKDIYEGDIVKTEFVVGYSSKHYSSFVDGTQRVGERIVKYNHCGFNLEMPNDPNYELTFEVIGNIHQTPQPCTDLQPKEQ